MDLNQLKYVLEIARTGSITHAAKNLYMGQPNLSKSIKELENEIGITIFNRTAKGVVLTPSGKNFAGYARSIVKQMNSLSELYKNQSEEKLSFKISVPRASYISYIFGKFIDKYKDKEVDIAYHETNSLNVISDVALHNSDFGIIRYQKQHKAYFEKLCFEKELKCEPLWTYNMVVLMSDKHPLADLHEIPYNILSEYTEIIQSDFNPVLSNEDTAKIKVTSKSSIAVFDRGSQFDILNTVQGSYVWVSPVPFSILYKHELVQKPCPNVNDYCDVLVFPAHSTLSPLATEFISKLQVQINELCDIINSTN